MIYHTRFGSLHGSVLTAIRQHRLVPAGMTQVLAISGGQDSLCLGQLWLDLAPQFGWQLVVAHLDHRWRADSAQCAAHVEQLAQKWGVPFYLNVAAAPPATESAARAWRYQWLAELALQLGASAVLTAHTATELRAETLLLNLFRGAGARGLTSLDWQRPLVPGVTLVRPLLGMSREETFQFCQERGLPIWEDSSNQNLNYLRNRVRLELLPYLAQYFNPQSSRQLAQTAELLAAEDDYLQQVSQTWFLQLWQTDPLALQAEPLRALPVALQRRVIQLFLEQRFAGNSSFMHVEEVRALLAQPNGSRTSSLAQGQSIVLTKGWLEWS